MLFLTVTVNIYDIGIKSILKNMFTENTACRRSFEILRFTTSADRPQPRYHKVYLRRWLLAWGRKINLYAFNNNHFERRVLEYFR